MNPLLLTLYLLYYLLLELPMYYPEYTVTYHPIDMTREFYTLIIREPLLQVP